MTLFQALIFGLVEGLTEFLPISSTAHLIMTSAFFDMQQSEFVSFFEVFIQSGAILAVVVLYFNFILKHKSYILKLITSFIPTATVGFLLHPFIKSVFFNSTMLISLSLISIGVLFIVLEYFIKQGKFSLIGRLSNLTYKHAFLIGLLQSMAVIPGVSRAGAVIVGMMLLRYRRDEAALYSFLLAVPTILAASIFDLLKTDLSIISQEGNIMALMTGFVTSFVVALLVIRWLIQYLQKNSLAIFGAYRILVGATLLFASVV